jgi:hypothetical protein
MDVGLMCIIFYEEFQLSEIEMCHSSWQVVDYRNQLKVQMVLLLRRMSQYKSLTLGPQPMFIPGCHQWSIMLSQWSSKDLMLQNVSF